MHPQAHHKTTAKKHEDARWLGFFEKEKQPLDVNADKSSIPRLQMTPSKAISTPKCPITPTFEFAFQREQSLELSPAAKKMMEEKREEAKRVKEQMKSETHDATTNAVMQRRIATPKSQRGRFSDAHKQQFRKMDSIAGHASAYRKDPTKLAPEPSPLPSPAKPLKRSPSKANIGTAPPKYSSGLPSSDSDDQSSPRKRIRHEGIGRDSTKSISHLQTTRLPKPSTPSKSSVIDAAATSSDRSAVTPSRTSTKSQPKPDIALLAQTPTRAGIFGNQQSSVVKTNLLARSPLKAHGIKSPCILQEDHANKQAIGTSSHFLTAMPSPTTKIQDKETKQTSDVLAKTPETMKTKDEQLTRRQNQACPPATTSKLQQRFDMLRSIPIKSILRTPNRLYSDDPAKVAAGTHFATPPQHIGLKRHSRAPATAPVQKHVDFSSSTKAREASKKASVSSLFSARKSDATPATQSLVPITYPSLNGVTPVEANTSPKPRQSAGPHDFTFRAGHEIVFAPTTSPSPRKQSSAAGFTIRAVVDEDAREVEQQPAMGSKKRKMEFENERSVENIQSSPTVTLGSKKRKFDFENEMAERDADVVCSADKENMPVDHDTERPLKRLKATQSPAPTKAVCRTASALAESKKRTTLGVKPKNGARTSPNKTATKRGATTISMARLNALAMPKKRA